MHKQSRVIGVGLALVATLACGTLVPGTAPVSGVSTIVAETLNAATLAASAPADTAVVPSGLTADVPRRQHGYPGWIGEWPHAETVAAVVGQEDAPWWELAPEHVRVTLQGYALQGKFHDAEIVVFPAAEYGAVNESAAANIQMLQGVLSNPGSVPDSKNLPHITFFNAGPVFQAQVAVVPFQGGYGIRALTEYAQYAAPVNNNDMFYHFQGLTSDGKKYIVAILPVTAPPSAGR